jgi:hypothetical protein
LGTSVLDLGCANLIVSGAMDLESGEVSQARDVTIGGGGALTAGSGVLEVTGDWDNAGTFTGGAGPVQLVDGCSRASALILGSTTFTRLSITTSSGKLVSFENGSTQTVTGELTLTGQVGGELQIDSTSSGNEAFIDLTGSQDIAAVDVNDNHAIGATLFGDADSSLGPNTLGWLISAAIPALSTLALVLAAAAVAALGARRLRGF